jgi:hypothetical protein
MPTRNTAFLSSTTKDLAKYRPDGGGSGKTT